MSDNEITLSREVRAPVETVWGVVTDIDSAVSTLSGVVAVERLSGPGYQVGTRWRETRKVMGKEAAEEMWVVEVETPSRTVIKARSSGADYTTVFMLHPTAAGTTIDMSFGADVRESSLLTKVANKVFGGLGTRITRKMMESDLADIAARAEALAAVD